MELLPQALAEARLDGQVIQLGAGTPVPPGPSILSLEVAGDSGGEAGKSWRWYVDSEVSSLGTAGGQGSVSSAVALLSGRSGWYPRVGLLPPVRADCPDADEQRAAVAPPSRLTRVWKKCEGVGGRATRGTTCGGGWLLSANVESRQRRAHGLRRRETNLRRTAIWAGWVDDANARLLNVGEHCGSRGRYFSKRRGRGWSRDVPGWSTTMRFCDIGCVSRAARGFLSEYSQAVERACDKKPRRHCCSWRWRWLL